MSAKPSSGPRMAPWQYIALAAIILAIIISIHLFCEKDQAERAAILKSRYMILHDNK